MKGINTILFDLDGTLLDTDEFIIQATEHALSSLSYPVPDRLTIRKTMGNPFPNYYFILAGESADAGRLVEMHREFQYANYNLVKPFPNTLETLSKLKEKGYKLGIVTARSEKTSYQTLKDSGIYHLFDGIISWEDVEKHKPDPDPVLKALKLLNALPSEAVMVGDSHFDIEAGFNAGTKTVRVTYGFHTDNLNNPKPDFIISDIKDLLKLF